MAKKYRPKGKEEAKQEELTKEKARKLPLLLLLQHVRSNEKPKEMERKKR